MRLGRATREVERQLQTARLKAVSANRPLRVRFNFPAVWQLRIIEVTGVAATDLDGNRCDEARFPFHGPNDADPATPALDGPVRMLHFTITLTGVAPAVLAERHDARSCRRGGNADRNARYPDRIQGP